MPDLTPASAAAIVEDVVKAIAKKVKEVDGVEPKIIVGSTSQMAQRISKLMASFSSHPRVQQALGNVKHRGLFTSFGVNAGLDTLSVQFSRPRKNGVDLFFPLVSGVERQIVNKFVEWSGAAKTASDLELIHRVASNHVAISRGVLGPGGLMAPGGSKLTLQEGAAYWLGASTSPQMVILTSVGDERVKYKAYPFTGGEKTMERWIAADLLDKGTRTHLKYYGNHMDSGLKHSLESLLRGGKGRKEDPKDYKPVIIQAVASDEFAGQDLWRAAEEYGGVGGLEKDGETIYEISAQNKAAEAMKNDRRFKILSVKDRPARGDD